jgi:putative exporter of polyketide antibiotics
MLWYKNWLETRWVFAIATVFALVPLPLAGDAAHSLPDADNLMHQLGLLFVFAAALLAGAGIRTRAGIRAKGLHGSMHYLLSMPVSRLRIFAARVSLGFVEFAGVIAVVCIGAWLALPVLRAHADPSEMLRYGLVVLACGSAYYFLAVLAASLINDEMAKTWGTLGAVAVVWWMGRYAGISPSFDLLRTLVDASPVQTSIPWAAIGLSAAVSPILVFAALKVVERREY